jgi:hypothetical protein
MGAVHGGNPRRHRRTVAMSIQSGDVRNIYLEPKRDIQADACLDRAKGPRRQQVHALLGAVTKCYFRLGTIFGALLFFQIMATTQVLAQASQPKPIVPLQPNRLYRSPSIHTLPRANAVRNNNSSNKLVHNAHRSPFRSTLVIS